MHFSDSLSLLLPLALISPAFAQLNKLAQAKGKYIGSATDNPEITDQPYVKILKQTDEFGVITPGNGQKWQFTEPNQNSFDFSSGDAIVSLAQQSPSQKVRCHTLVWHSQLPGWVSNGGPTGKWTNATLIAAMKNHIKNEVTHYKGKCLHWDVVNEAFNEDGTYRSSPFYDVIGPEFIPIAFQTAALYDPDVKLYYNDYNMEYNGNKAVAGRTLIKSMKARGIKVDGVGFQAHLIVGSTPDATALTTLLQSFTALGVDVAYTEVDIRVPVAPPTSAQTTQQSTDYVNVLKSCLNTSRCVGLTFWDFTDKYSWIPSVFAPAGSALPWDDKLNKKPAYFAMLSALGGSASATTTTTLRTSTTSAGGATSKTTTTTARTTTSASGGGSGTSPKWGQCGGTGWTGPTACAAGSTCTYSNAWYSQCL